MPVRPVAPSATAGASPREARRPLAPERLLVIVVTVLVSFGLVMVYSSSSSSVLLGGSGNPLGYALKQAVFALIGVGAYHLATRIDIRRLRRLAGASVVLSAVLLLVVLIPGVGVEVNGSRRWLPLPLVGAQPSELAKLALILWIATAAAHNPRSFLSLRGAAPYLGVTTVFAAMILMQPDLGTASMLFVVALAMLLVAGTPSRDLVLVAGVAATAAALAVLAAPYRRARMLAFLDPGADPIHNGFQIIQAKLAFGSGGLTGVGLGDGIQKARYLPEAHTDMILATVGEELGVLGVVFVLGLLALVAMSAFRIAMNARDPQQRLLAVGLATLIAAQSLDNVGAVLGMMPITGVPLPFVSYGGSSLIVLLFSVGILVNIGRRAQTTSNNARDRRTAARGDRGERDGRARDARVGGGRGAARAWG